MTKKHKRKTDRFGIRYQSTLRGEEGLIIALFMILENTPYPTICTELDVNEIFWNVARENNIKAPFKRTAELTINAIETDEQYKYMQERMKLMIEIMSSIKKI